MPLLPNEKSDSLPIRVLDDVLTVDPERFSRLWTNDPEASEGEGGVRVEGDGVELVLKDFKMSGRMAGERLVNEGRFDGDVVVDRLEQEDEARRSGEEMVSSALVFCTTVD
jgi:hypothetical protein